MPFRSIPIRCAPYISLQSTTLRPTHCPLTCFAVLRFRSPCDSLRIIAPYFRLLHLALPQFKSHQFALLRFMPSHFNPSRFACALLYFSLSHTISVRCTYALLYCICASLRPTLLCFALPHFISLDLHPSVRSAFALRFAKTSTASTARFAGHQAVTGRKKRNVSSMSCLRVKAMKRKSLPRQVPPQAWCQGEPKKENERKKKKERKRNPT